MGIADNAQVEEREGPFTIDQALILTVSKESCHMHHSACPRQNNESYSNFRMVYFVIFIPTPFEVARYLGYN